eukprot:s535_g11.t1
MPSLPSLAGANAKLCRHQRRIAGGARKLLSRGVLPEKDQIRIINFHQLAPWRPSFAFDQMQQPSQPNNVHVEFHLYCYLLTLQGQNPSKPKFFK